MVIIIVAYNIPLTPNKSYSTAVANDEARILTKLLDNSKAEITFSRLSRIFNKYLALLLPFLNLRSILGLDDAVRAVSEPDRNPDIITRIVKQIKSIIVINDITLISYYLFQII